MDYGELAAEIVMKMRDLMKAKVPKQINTSMRGEMFILHYILRRGEDVLPSELSVAMDASSARVATALNGLESKGYIERRVDKADRRKIKVSLTDVGKKIMEDHHEDMRKKIEMILMELGEGDAREFIRIVTRITDISKTLCL